MGGDFNFVERASQVQAEGGQEEGNFCDRLSREFKEKLARGRNLSEVSTDVGTLRYTDNSEKVWMRVNDRFYTNLKEGEVASTMTRIS